MLRPELNIETITSCNNDLNKLARTLYPMLVTLAFNSRFKIDISFFLQQSPYDYHARARKAHIKTLRGGVTCLYC